MKLQELFESREDYILEKQGAKLWAAYVKDPSLMPVLQMQFPTEHGDGKESFFPDMRHKDPASAKKYAPTILKWIANRLANYEGQPRFNGGLSSYLQWVVNQYIAGNFILEDLYKVEEDLVEFKRLKDTKVWGGVGGFFSKDINVYDISVLKGAVGLAQRKEEKDPDILKSRRQLDKEAVERMIKDKELVIVGKDELATIYRPKTEEAACYIGRGTKWCTSATKSDNAFYGYDQQGPLYIVVAEDGRKYQLHFETGQYMDELDERVDSLTLVHRYPAIRKYLSVPAFTVLSEKMQHRYDDAYYDNEKLLYDMAELVEFIEETNLPESQQILYKQWVKDIDTQHENSRNAGRWNAN